MYENIYPNPIQLQNSINMIGDSIESEKKDAQFYQWLIDNIPASDLSSNQVKQIKSIIESIRNDELNHNKMFQNMYHQLTGNIVTPIDEEFIPPESFKVGITDALMGELEAVKKYRLIMSGLPSLYYRDIVFNILTDELRHASLYNYIFASLYNLV
ncbi:ferritin family protein [Metaclostridioides mangenotii]|uniref:ferritin family protein n=1 Tax=Metaclostridioides mangenotii TaxID=1540 RepID=UPI00056EF031|nr:ferritin-like domain-containing protein [Clostridioides mangenotii]